MERVWDVSWDGLSADLTVSLKDVNSGVHSVLHLERSREKTTALSSVFSLE